MSLLSPDGRLVAVLVPVVGCVLAALVLAAVIRVVGRRLLDEPGQPDALARTAFIGVSAVGVLLGLGRLVDREATDAGLRASLGGIIGALPGLAIAFILLIVGLLVAAVLRATITKVVSAIRPSLARGVGAIAYWSVVTLVALIAVEQVGVDVGIIRQLLLLSFGGLVAALAVGLGLGMRDLIASVMAGRHVEAVLEVGQDVTVGLVSGEVEAIGHVSVRLRAPDGRAVEVPHTAFLDGPATIG